MYFTRVTLRVDTLGSAWQTVGGFGTTSQLSHRTEFGLTPGTELIERKVEHSVMLQFLLIDQAGHLQFSGLNRVH